MSDSNIEQQSFFNKHKKILIGIFIALLIIGGIVIYFVAFKTNITPPPIICGPGQTTYEGKTCVTLCPGGKCEGDRIKYNTDVFVMSVCLDTYYIKGVPGGLKSTCGGSSAYLSTNVNSTATTDKLYASHFILQDPNDTKSTGDVSYGNKVILKCLNPQPNYPYLAACSGDYDGVVFGSELYPWTIMSADKNKQGFINYDGNSQFKFYLNTTEGDKTASWYDGGQNPPYTGTKNMRAEVGAICVITATKYIG